MKITVIAHPLGVKLSLENGEAPTFTPCDNDDQAYSYARGLVDGMKAAHRLSAGPLGYQIQQFDSAFLERLTFKGFTLDQGDGFERLIRTSKSGGIVRISDRTGLKLPSEDDWAVVAWADMSDGGDEADLDAQHDDEASDIWASVKAALDLIGAA